MKGEVKKLHKHVHEKRTIEECLLNSIYLNNGYQIFLIESMENHALFPPMLWLYIHSSKGLNIWNM